MKSTEAQLRELKRGVVDLASEAELTKKLDYALSKKKKLRVKLGVDPTAPDIHFGHTVVLRKLRQFQDLGHKAVLIIGDYTALVGDPSGTQKTRPQLSPSDIKANAKTYFEQVESILDMKSIEIHYNGEWFKKMPFIDVIRLTSRMTVARMLERDDFSKRYKKGTPIGIHEFIYPLMQGYDSIMVKADVELGGTDQLFNLLVGRQLQKEEGQSPQVILTTPLLEGTDGVQKMSKSLNNAIGVRENPKDMFGKIMSISDDLMWRFYELLSDASLEDISEKQNLAKSGKVNPKDLKVELAFELVSRFHSAKKAKEAEEEFRRVFKAKKMPSKIEKMTLKVSEGEISIVKLVVLSKCATSNSEARRLVQQGAVSVDNEKIRDPYQMIPVKGEITLKVGKRRFKKIKLKK